MACVPIIKVSEYRDSEVYTLEGKRIGRIKESNFDYFITLKRGLVADEEFRIPTSAISAVENDGDSNIVRLNLKEEQIKHGFEFTKGKPNSDFMHGISESEPLIPGERQVIRYEPTQDAEATNATIKRPPAISEYLCDMCNEKFCSPQELQWHRTERHRAPTGI
jgi:sporulation protein YlmC with PRC-barrel domain